MSASTLCAIHCALTPLLITLAPLVGLGFLFEERFETIFIMVTVGLAFLSIAWGFMKKHRSFEPFYLLLLGASLLYLAHHLEHTHHPISDYLPHPILMAAGGLSIATSHFFNLKLCHHYDCDESCHNPIHEEEHHAHHHHEHGDCCEHTADEADVDLS